MLRLIHRIIGHTYQPSPPVSFDDVPLHVSCLIRRDIMVRCDCGEERRAEYVAQIFRSKSGAQVYYEEVTLK